MTDRPLLPRPLPRRSCARDTAPRRVGGVVIAIAVVATASLLAGACGSGGPSVAAFCQKAKAAQHQAASSTPASTPAAYRAQLSRTRDAVAAVAAAAPTDVKAQLTRIARFYDELLGDLASARTMDDVTRTTTDFNRNHPEVDDLNHTVADYEARRCGGSSGSSGSPGTDGPGATTGSTTTAPGPASS